MNSLLSPLDAPPLDAATARLSMEIKATSQAQVLQKLLQGEGVVESGLAFIGPHNPFLQTSLPARRRRITC